MHRKVLFFFLAFLYYSLSTYGLYLFDGGVLVTALMLYGFPSLILARATLAPAPILLTVALLGGGLSLILETVAGMYGLWYSLGSDTTRLFGLVPLEIVVYTTLQVLFYALMYEVLFDDANYSKRHALERFGFFGFFALATIGLVAIHAFIFNGVFVSYSYLWIIGSVFAACFSMLLLYKNLSIHFFDRMINFSLVAAVPSLLGLWLGVANVHKIYAFKQAYIGTTNLFGQVVPLEEIILLFALPLLVAMVYELYLDDRF